MPKNEYKNKAKNKVKNKPAKKRRFFTFSLKFNPNPRLRKIIGLAFILFSAYQLIAFTSYLFTWAGDQDKVALGWGKLLFDKSIVVDNWLGKLGALISNTFIFNGFGITSFLFILLFFLVGFKIIFKISLIPLKKTFKYSLFFFLWLPVVLAYVAGSMPILGGGYGFFLTAWLKTIVGTSGTALLLLFIGAAFIISNFSFRNYFKKNTENAEEQEEDLNEDSEAVSDNNVMNTFTADAGADTEIVAETENIAGEIEPEKEDTENEINLSVETPAEEASENKDGEVDFSVEEAQPEETELTESEINEKVKEFGEYDPTLDLPNYQLPSIELLEAYGKGGEIKVDKEELERNKNKIVTTLENYNIKIKEIKATIGPTITLYEIVPAPGVRISKIKNLEDDIALSLAALGIRIIAPMPGKGTIGIEVPNQNPDIVSMRSVLSSDKFQNTKMELPFALGKTISNETFVADLTRMPHLLMAGATGQGKSVGLNAILASLLYKKHPSQLKFVLVDPKKVELTLFSKIERHFLAKLPDTEDAIITDTSKVVNTVNSLCKEMDERYELLKDAQVRNIKEYNAKFIARKLNPEKGHKYLPYIVLVIDEFADLIMTAGKEIETPIARLAQLARAIGIHLIVATQRPSTNIITGIIKANFPARIAFRVTSQIDSRTILDAGGAEQLIGKGDMLLSQGSSLIRLQCAFIDTPEVEKLTEFIGSQRGYPSAFVLPEYQSDSASGSGGLGDEERDELFEDAAKVIVQTQQGSTSLLQRKLKLGYNRAGRIIDQLEAAGIVGPFEGSKARQVLIPDEVSLEQFLNTSNDE